MGAVSMQRGWQERLEVWFEGVTDEEVEVEPPWGAMMVRSCVWTSDPRAIGGIRFERSGISVGIM